jgi:hypothetical protein
LIDGFVKNMKKPWKKNVNYVLKENVNVVGNIVQSNGINFNKIFNWLNHLDIHKSSSSSSKQTKNNPNILFIYYFFLVIFCIRKAKINLHHMHQTDITVNKMCSYTISERNTHTKKTTFRYNFGCEYIDRNVRKKKIYVHTDEYQRARESEIIYKNVFLFSSLP